MSLIKNSKELNKASLLVIAGPTASGKTALSLLLADLLDGEIVSADSLQIYKEFDIGSAKPDQKQLKRVRHHLVGVLSPETEINAFEYSNMARKAISDIVARGKFPILVGGSGLYIRSAIDGLLKVDGVFDGVKESILEEVRTKGLKSLYDELLAADPETALSIHSNDEMRIVRALELSRVTHKTRKEIAGSAIPLDIGKIHFFSLNIERKDLYLRVNERVDKMLSSGLLKEVKAITDKYGFDVSPLGGLGYRQFAEYIKGTLTLERAVYLTKMETRHYAKRQITWFKKDKRVNWLDAKEDTSLLLKKIIDVLKDAPCQ